MLYKSRHHEKHPIRKGEHTPNPPSFLSRHQTRWRRRLSHLFPPYLMNGVFFSKKRFFHLLSRDASKAPSITPPLRGWRGSCVRRTHYDAFIVRTIGPRSQRRKSLWAKRDILYNIVLPPHSSILFEIWGEGIKKSLSPYCALKTSKE